ncbi:MAG: sigma-54-dependent transcriptional regulator [Salinibacter sp.]
MATMVLVVDDDAHIRKGLCDILEHEGYETRTAGDGKTALVRLEDTAAEVMLLDLKIPRIDGMEVLRRAKDDHPGVPVIIVSGKGTIQRAVEATKIGAYDFLEKPVDAQRLLVTVRNALEKARLKRQRDRLLEEARERYQMVGTSEAMQRIYDRIDKAAASDCRVLITGESGTGKELVARAIHHNSDRAGGPFVTVNCAALPEDLIESELFGHEEGAFTGAKDAHTGKFAQADGGTLFLDEVGSMSLPAQSKTLRAIETGIVQPIGSEQVVEADPRILAATNADLQAAIEAEAFREDLYYRLNVLTIEMPPLRERREDIPELAAHFLAEVAENESPPELDEAALAVLMSHDWPGNVRELQNVIQRLVVLSEGDDVGAGAVQQALDRDAETPDAGNLDLRAARGRFEAAYIHQALRAHDGAVKATAEALGIDRTSLWRKMDEYGIERPS